MTATNFSREFLSEADAVARKHLFLRDRDVRRRREVPELQSVLYTEPGEYGGYLFVCVDGSLLFGPKDLGKRFHRRAFEQGLRTPKEALIDRKCSLEEEIFSLAEDAREL